MIRMLTPWLVLAFTAVLCVGCDAELDVSDDGVSQEAPAEVDPDLEPDPEPDPEPSLVTAPEPLASLSGTVSRTASIQEDGQGDLYVALFDSNPVSMDPTVEPVLVGRAILFTQDLVAEDAVVDYLIEEVPPRSEPYFVITFFDDNGTTTDDDPSPDKGDLVSLDGFSAFEVVMDTAEHFEHDLVLNAVMPL
ncbi:MAG: hypothetical protein ACPGU1_15960 [Myxococcota bacterium]